MRLGQMQLVTIWESQTHTAFSEQVSSVQVPCCSLSCQAWRAYLAARSLPAATAAAAAWEECWDRSRSHLGHLICVTREPDLENQASHVVTVCDDNGNSSRSSLTGLSAWLV